MFESCQAEAAETVVRKERIYIVKPTGEKVRIGTRHHSVICLTQRGSTKTVMYMVEPKFVPVDDRGKPPPPSLPSTKLVLPLLRKHFGNFVVLHTDGAEAYSGACEMLRHEGYTVVPDSVIHSHGQCTAFGRHAVTGTDWAGCDIAVPNDIGELRIRVIKGNQKAEGCGGI